MRYGAAAEEDLPCLIYNRGGNREPGALSDRQAARVVGKLAGWGYVVLASQYRGNAGGEGQAGSGGADVDDVLGRGEQGHVWKGGFAARAVSPPRERGCGRPGGPRPDGGTHGRAQHDTPIEAVAMDTSKSERNEIESHVDRAYDHLRAARELLDSRTGHSACIEASAECMALAVGAVLAFLQVDAGRTQGWGEDWFLEVTGEIQERGLSGRLAEEGLGAIRLPRLLLLAGLWAGVCLLLGRGQGEAAPAPDRELFKLDEVDLAVRHAEECYRAAAALRHLDGEKLSALVARGAGA